MTSSPFGAGPPAAFSPVTGSPIASTSRWLHASSAHFRDTAGRTVLLRGVNLSSAAKTPVGQPGWRLDGFWDAARSGDMSFVGRVLTLETANTHLARLREWGFNCLRFVLTWESIEHDGPGKYDREYIDYTVTLLKKCKEFGFYVYMDPHQDLWSRFSGGSGAPYWTLIACGLDPEHFTATNAAVIECEWKNADGDSAPDEFPAMIWASNYSRLACQTLFTLFFAGRDYASKCELDGVNIQDYLQNHYFAAMRELGNAIRDARDDDGEPLLDECVIGWDSINEPNAGLIGVEDLAQHGKESILRVGPTPTPIQAMRLGMGQRVEVENYRVGSLGSKRDGSVVVDPQGVRAWLDPDAEANGSPYGWTRGPDWELGTCVWALHGVWDPETDELLQPDYFDWWHGDEPGVRRKVSFGADYWLQHFRAWAPVVRSFHPEAILFAHSPVFAVPPMINGPELKGRAAYSTHFYDGLTLVTKHWNWFNADALGILRGKYASVILGVKIGEAAIRKSLRDQLGMLRQDGLDALGAYPTMMGEIGIPYDLDKKKAYSDGDYSNQVRALDASLNACDGANVLNYTIWTYCPDNSHQWGDLWNGEDLSLWSDDDVERMSTYRASYSHLDLVGKISSKRSRALSRNGSPSSSLYGSQTPTPNASSTRLSTNTIDFKTSPATTISSLPSSSSSRSSSTANSPLPPFTELSPPPPFDSDLLETSAFNLSDGARAISAFCRPYPVKTVGTPLEINFDIRSSLFALTVRVDAGDVIDDMAATEIYVPLVHYAAFPSRVCHELQDDQSDLPFLRQAEKEFGAPMSLPDESTADDPRTLALDITASVGRWEVQDQLVKWYYPRPTSGSMKVKIEIRRINGAIPAWVIQSGARPNDSSFFLRSQTADDGRATGLYRQLAVPGLVMAGLGTAAFLLT